MKERPIITLLAIITLTAIFSASIHAEMFPANGGTTGTGGGVLFGTNGILLGSGQDDASAGPDVNLSYGPNTTVFRWLGCGPYKENASSQPQAQNNTVGIDRVCNNGTATGTVQIRLNTNPVPNWTIKAGKVNATASLITLTTSYQNIIPNLAPNTCGYVWLVANCSYVTKGPSAYEQYVIG